MNAYKSVIQIMPVNFGILERVGVVLDLLLEMGHSQQVNILPDQKTV